jgi:PIG-X / PBN1
VQYVQQTVETLNSLTSLAPSFTSPFDTDKSTIYVSYPFQPLPVEEIATTKPPPPDSTNALTIRVPTGNLDHLVFVQPVTLLVMSLCAVYVAYTAILVAASRGVSSAKSSLQRHEKRKVE